VAEKKEIKKKAVPIKGNEMMGGRVAGKGMGEYRSVRAKMKEN